MADAYPVPRIEGIGRRHRGAVADLYDEAHANEWRPLLVSERELMARWEASRHFVWSVLMLLQQLGHASVIRGRGRSRTMVHVWPPGDAARKRLGRIRRTTERRAQPQSAVGVDLGLHFLDVQRITIAKHGAACRAAGLEPDDLVAQVVERIMVANVGEHRFDRAKGTLSTYIYRQGRSALLNMVDAKARRERDEVVGVTVNGEDIDAAEAAGRGDG